MYFVDNMILRPNDYVRVFNTLKSIDEEIGIVQDDPIYEIYFHDSTLIVCVEPDYCTTKYSNLIFGKQLSSKDLAEAGYMIVRDHANRIVHYYNKNNGTERSFKYADQESNHE